MGQHDFDTRVTKAEEFLKEGNQLKLHLPFRGREIIRKDWGMETMNRAIQRLENVSKVIKSPYMEGRVLVSILAPVKVVTGSVK